MRLLHRTRGVAAAILLGAAGAVSCGAPGPRPIRMWSDTFEFQVTMDPSPPHAREPILFTVVVLDKKTRELVDGGEGRVFATSQDRVSRWDSFTPGREAGSYTARLNFITAGDWSINLQFRRDSTRVLEKPAADIVQSVRGARPINERPTQ